MPNIVVIDVGTSSMRATVFDRRGQALHTVRSSYQPHYLGDGRVEQNPLTWLRSLIDLSRSTVEWAANEGLSLDAVSLTSQRSSAIPVDASGVPLHDAIMWQDTRTASLCEEMSDQIAPIYALTGLRLSPVLAAPKFSWFKKNRPDLYRQAHKLLTIADYLVMQMTGRFVTDHTYGSRTLLMNVQTLRWDAELLRVFDLDLEKLCELAPQGSVIGRISDTFRSQTGLPSGIPVISAGGDQQCGALGAGVLNPGSIQITTGTGSYVIAAIQRPHLDPMMKVLCSVAAVPGQFILESSILTTSALYSWTGKALYESADDTDMFRRLERDALSATAGANGLIFLPYFQGRGSPDWNANATGVLANMTLATTRADIVQSVLEGIAAEIAENVELIRDRLAGEVVVFSSGGLSNFDEFNQIQADMLNLPISVPTNKETTSLGAWITAAVAMGIFHGHSAAFESAQKGVSPCVYKPRAENVQLYEQIKVNRALLYKTLDTSGVYKQLRLPLSRT